MLTKRIVGFVGLVVISCLLTIVGLVLMFSSVSFGASLGESWVSNQEDSSYDTREYMMIIKMYQSLYVISGSILFAIGLLTAILTFFIFLFCETRKTK